MKGLIKSFVGISIWRMNSTVLVFLGRIGVGHCGTIDGDGCSVDLRKEGRKGGRVPSHNSIKYNHPSSQSTN